MSKEVIVAVPDSRLLGLHAQIIRHLMIRAMQEVVPDVRINVEYVVTRRWCKDAELIRDAAGRLVPWQPANEAAL